MDLNQSSLELLHNEPDNNNNNKLSYEIFSILESKFLFGYNDWKHVSPEHQNDAVKNQRGKICVLSIDGAGMRNIFAAKALAYLENALKTKSGDPNAAICDYFDVAAGTGIGGVFTAMLFSSNGRNRPVYGAHDTWQLLAEQGKRLYNTKSKSKSNSGGVFGKLFKKKQLKKVTGCENVMKEIFTVNGRALTLKDSLKPILIPCYDLKSSAPFLFSRADALEAESFDFEISEICSATSATPGLFEPVLLTSADGKRSCVGVDGGVAMSNPTAAAITHVLHNKR